MEFELFELKDHLLALDAEHPALQLLDDQLQMLDLLAAGTQLLLLLGECLAMGLKLSLERSQLIFMRSAELEAPLDAERSVPAMPLDPASQDPARERDPWTQYAIDAIRMQPENVHE